MEFKKVILEFHVLFCMAKLWKLWRNGDQFWNLLKKLSFFVQKKSRKKAKNFYENFIIWNFRKNFSFFRFYFFLNKKTEFFEEMPELVSDFS